MKNCHAEVLFLRAHGSWMDPPNATSVACHKAELSGISREFDESDGVRGRIKRTARTARPQRLPSQTSVTPTQTISTPAQRRGVTRSPRKNLPPSAPAA